MKLTIIRLQHLAPQDQLDLQKIWPGDDNEASSLWLNPFSELYAARFNARLLAAVQVVCDKTEGELKHFAVREATRRRGVGHYLLQEVMQSHPAITRWSVTPPTEPLSCAAEAFLIAEGFIPQHHCWVKQR
ncbi:MAG: PanD regulatory factor [Candidatus Erwinia impunctatus]|nr:PanD regulatory factor [Culicoides impunctatus]